MDTNKVAYWVALGVLALGLSSEYRQGHFVALHQAVERADLALCGVTARAERTLAATIGATGRSELMAGARSASVTRLGDGRLRSDLLRDQARAQAEVIRAEAEIRRAQMERVRSSARFQFRLVDDGNRGMTVFCPKTGTKTKARVVISRADLSDDLPEVEVSDSF